MYFDIYLLYTLVFLSVTCAKQLISYTWKLVKRSNRNKVKSMQLFVPLLSDVFAKVWRKSGQKKELFPKYDFIDYKYANMEQLSVTLFPNSSVIDSMHNISLPLLPFTKTLCKIIVKMVPSLEQIMYLTRFFLLLLSEIRSSIPTNRTLPH
jgi:hypothetical protein